LFWTLDHFFLTMPLVPSKLNFLPEFEGRDSLYSSILPRKKGGKLKIRILTVVPNDDHLAPIEASLSIATMLDPEDDEEYNAVSYYWGDTSEVDTVTMHGSDKGVPGLECKVPVTKCLTAALRQSRARASANRKPLRLWIDALRIKQTDAAERRFQVLIMSRIFGLATSVWIWLGESDELVESGLVTLFDRTDSEASNSATGAVVSSSRFTSSTLSLNEEVFYIKQFAAVNALPY
jgi:hypothetical protein